MKKYLIKIKLSLQEKKVNRREQTTKGLYKIKWTLPQNKNHSFHTDGHLWTACNHIPLSFSFNLDNAETDSLDSEGNEISIPMDDSAWLLSGALLL